MPDSSGTSLVEVANRVLDVLNPVFSTLYSQPVMHSCVELLLRRLRTRFVDSLS